MKKQFIERIIRERIVDTNDYRYVIKNTIEEVRIERLPVAALGTTDAIDGWEVVKVLGSSGAATTNKRR